MQYHGIAPACPLEEYNSMIDRLFTQLHSVTKAGYFVMSLTDLTLRDVNHYLIAFLGQSGTPDTYIDTPANTLLKDLLSAGIMASLKEEGDRINDVEYRVSDPNGSPRWGMINAVVTRLPENPDLLIIGSIQNISPLKASEERLRKSEEINNIIFSAMPDLLFRLDTNGTFLEFRGGLGHLLGQPESFLGKPASTILPPKLNERTLQGIRQVLSTQSPIAYEYDLPLQGEQRFFEARMFPSEHDTVLVIIRDITERHRAVESLENERIKYRTLIESAGDAILVAEADSGTIIEANPAAEQLFGVPRDSIIGLHQSLLYNDQTRQSALDIFRKHTSPQTPDAEQGQRTDTIEIFRQDGKSTPIEILASVFELQGRRLVQGIFRDISERVQAQKELHESEKKYRFLFRSSPANNILIQRDGIILDISDTFVRFLGYTREEITGTSLFDSFREPQKSRIREYVGRLFDGADTPGLDVDVIAKDGTIRTILFSPGFLPLEDDSGRTQSILLTGIDITNRKLAEQVIRENEERYRTIFEASTTATVILNSDTIITLANNEFEKISGLPKQEIEGKKSWQEFVSPEDLPRMLEYNRQRRLPGGNAPPAYSFAFLDRDGNRRTMFVSIANIPGTDMQVASLLDLTQKEEAQKALQESEDRYRRLVELSPDAIAVHSDGIIQYTNPAARRIFAAQSDEALLGKALLDFVHPDYHHIVTRRMQNSYAKDKTGEALEEKMIRLNGEVFDAEVSTAPIHFKGQNASLVVVRDITERKNAERALRESEQRFRALIENSSDIIQTLDENGVTQYVSPAITRVLGYGKTELEGTTAFDYVHPDDIPETLRAFKNLLKNRGGQRQIELQTIHKDGSYRTVSILATNLLEHPAVGQIVLNYHDITTRKTFEQQLEAEKERLAVTLESIGDGVITVDTSGTITMLNRVAEDLTGWKNHEAAGKPLSKVFTVLIGSEGTTMNNLVETILVSDGVARFSKQTTLVDRRANSCLIAMSGAPIRHPGGDAVGVVLVFRDITRQQNMEEELLKRQKLESVGILAGGIAHDFNNILTAIMGNITIAKLYADSPEQVSERIIEAEKAVGRAKDLTYQLLTFSRGGMPIKKTKSITQLITDSTSFALRGSNVKCNISIPEDIWPVDIDEGQISQVVHNLTINADQAMPEGGIIDITAINHRIKKDDHIPLPAGNYVKINIADSGTGILPDHLKKIFDPYFSTKRKGSGLGLTVTYSIIKNHDGHIDVHSEIGGGTRFTLYLPASSQAPKQKALRTAQLKHGSGRILVMDDEPSIRDSLSVMLTSLGYQVETAEDGAQTLEIYEREHMAGRGFNLVIMDLTIPGGMGGRETMEKLLEKDPDAKGIVSSGYSNDPVMAQFADYGFCGVIQKPYTVKELADILHRVLQGGPESGSPS